MSAPPTLWFAGLGIDSDELSFAFRIEAADGRVARATVRTTPSGQIVDVQTTGPGGDRDGTTGSAALDAEIRKRVAEELCRARAADGLQRFYRRRARALAPQGAVK